MFPFIMAKLEKTLAVLFVLGLTMRLSHIEGGDFIVLVSLFILSFLYFPFGFALLNRIRARDLFKRESYRRLNAPQLWLAVLLGFCLATATLAIPFVLLRWNGNGLIRIIGGFGVVATGILVWEYRKKLENERSWLVRSALVLIVLFTIGFAPRHSVPNSQTQQVQQTP
jgi:hypothetical protein